MSTSEIHVQVQSKLDAARAALDRAIAGNQHVCLTCSFQAEDVLLAKLAVEFNPRIPVLFLDTGYHFAETYAYRDRIVSEWQLNLINLLPSQTVPEQEAQHELLISRRRMSVAGCERSNRCSRLLPVIVCGLLACAGSRQRAELLSKSLRLSRCPAASRSE